ncbi:non-heme iron oxygenase ferredoxin subunit [Nocardioides sp. zg-ZUI104]|uniref:non-heme iron oxygenase ferredoxin subunit n=1 Tax=Nocardioides faecalis TaxID=2803858 RepID=UPI001BCCBFFF|nr:non-heme iron oxygenase ferredoxin subunit [Nocardioides faecalis]MBS4753931.1 non-heme iron oxygenase ferredoxin subunit [Nocardioides faecalis]
MSFERACALSEIDTDEARAVTVGGVELALAKVEPADGGAEVFALQDLCSHAAVPLSEGDVVDGTVECWLHGSCFDLRTGKPANFPATEPVATFPVELRPDPSGAIDVYVDVQTTLNGVTPA